MSFKVLLLAAFVLMPVAAPAQESFAPKVLVITMFDGETAPWRDNLELTRRIEVSGLPDSAPELLCDDDLCVMTTTMGFANAASSVAAVALSDAVDLGESYILIAGIAGVDPEHGTLGSAHWARWVVDGGLRHLIDPREIPADWSTGSLTLGTTEPGGEGGWSAGSEVYELNADLVDRALELTQGVELTDSDRAAEYRATYDAEAARRAPFVSACDTVSSDTYWHGRIIGEAMEDRTEQMTDGDATYCTTQMEDNATLTALSRAAAAGAVDFDRVAVLRTGSNFDRQPEGGSAAASLAADSGGFGPATENAFRVANALAQEIIRNWDDWKDGVPTKP